VATFSITIITPTRTKPSTRAADVAERAAIQQTLLRIISQVSNNGSYSGSIEGGSATAEYDYECKGEAA